MFCFWNVKRGENLQSEFMQVSIQNLEQHFIFGLKIKFPYICRI